MDKNALGKYLRNLRKTYGYTQEYVSSHLNVIHQTYSHYETGRIVPPADTLYILANLYHVPAENLLRLIVPTIQAKEAPPSELAIENTDELSLFINHVNDPEHYSRFHHLSSSEKRMLYYFEQLNHHNQEKLIDMIKVELKHQV